MGNVFGEIKMRGFWGGGLGVMLGVGLLAGCQKSDEGAKTGDAPQASAAAPAAPTSPPKRKPGLWAQTVSTAGMTQTTKICLDEATESRMTAWGQQVSDGMCARNVITPTAGGWSFESECDMGEAGKSVTKGTATGDFDSKYVIKATTTTTGASMAQANGVHEMEMTAAWEGPCPAGMKPGDMSLPGGVTINMNQMSGMMRGK